MASKSYGSITLIDVTDIGEFSVYPTTNLPLSVIYDPDQPSFTPDWSQNGSHLELTPVIYYAGQPKTTADTGVSVTWTRQEGINAESALVTGESVGADGKLTVSDNMFTATSTMLTYIVTASYKEPTSQQTLTAKGQITFSLVKQASRAKTAKITGENIFKYNGDGSPNGATSIKLTGTVNNVTITAWQYQSGVDGTGNPTWTNYPGSGTTNTLTVNESDSVFVNDRCTIRLKTSDNSVFDIFTITKLKDGSTGTASVSAVLTNDFQFLPANSEGVITSFDGATTQCKVYEGGTDKTNEWTFTLSVSSADITYTASATQKTNDTVQITGMTSDTGYVTFTCKKGTSTLVKNFSLTKIEAGADGKDPVIYSVESDSYTINKSFNDDKTLKALTPNQVTFSAFQTTGNVKIGYSGRFAIYIDGDMTSDVAHSTKDEKTFTWTAVACDTVTCVLYKAGAMTDELDRQTVVFTSDGYKGEQGKQGEDGDSAVNVIVGNEADVIPCTSDNKTIAQFVIQIPFTAYQGLDRIGATATVGTINNIGGTPAVSIVNTSASTDGLIKISIPAGTSINADHDRIQLTFTLDGGQSVTSYYSWTRSTAATNGKNAILFQLYTPKGDVFYNGQGQLQIKAQVTDGSQNKAATSYHWSKYDADAGRYDALTTDQAGEYTGTGTDTLTVYGGFVDSYASFQCVARYDGTDYTQYCSLIDKTDPLQVSVLSSIGNQIVNKQGVGALYVKVFQNGDEIDPMPSEIFSTTQPSTGLYYYYIDQENKKIQLKHRDTESSPWKNADITLEADYKWTYRNAAGEVISSVNGNVLPSDGKVIYIDGDLINKKIVVDAIVTYPIV